MTDKTVPQRRTCARCEKKFYPQSGKFVCDECLSKSVEVIDYPYEPHHDDWREQS